MNSKELKEEYEVANARGNKNGVCVVLKNDIARIWAQKLNIKEFLVFLYDTSGYIGNVEISAIEKLL